MTEPTPTPPDAKVPSPTAAAAPPSDQAKPVPAASVPAAAAAASPKPASVTQTEVPKAPATGAKPAESAKPTAAKPSVPPVPPAPRPPAPAPADASGAPAAQPFRSALPVLTAIGFIFVLVVLAWIWNSQVEMRLRIAELSVPPPPAVEPARVVALETRVKVLEQRIGALESRPVPAPPPPQIVTSDNSAALTAQMTELATRLKAAEQREGSLAERAATAQRVQQALAALDMGEPLGDLPGAPPALARFAKAKPPTEAGLRLSFPIAADAAEKASRPAADGKSLGERILMHASSLVTIRKGNQVLVGAPAATLLGEAQARVEAGDLAGALTVLDGLDSSAAQAMADWRGQAKALLDARAALTQMARG
jgi:hypothetical protein